MVMLSIFLLFISTACNSKNENQPNDSLTIYTSIYPLQFIIEEIAGEDVIVESIYPPGVDAHTFEPTSKQLTEIAQADLFIYMGGEMESVTDTIAGALDSQNITLLELSSMEGLLEDNETNHHHNHEHAHDHNNLDPHVWLDPLKMVDMAERIKQELIQLKQEDETAITERFNEFQEKMTTLDEAYNSQLQGKDNKQIIVAHAAFGYWENRYGIRQIALRGISTEQEPSQKEIVDMIQIAQENNAEYILFDQYGTDKLAEIIQDQIGLEALYLHNLEVLTEEDIKNNEDYISLMKKNLDTLDQAIQ